MFYRNKILIFVTEKQKQQLKTFGLMLSYSEIVSIISSAYTKKFIVTFTDGTKKEMRLFVSAGNAICEYKKRSRRYGYYISVSDFENVEPVINKVSQIQIFRRNLNNVIKYLSKSGLWYPMLATAMHINNLSDDEIMAIKSYDSFLEWSKSNPKFHWFGEDCWDRMFTRDAIKTVNYQTSNREICTSIVKKHIDNKQNYYQQWRKGYDNSLELNFTNQYPRGWYSEEYKDCGNGHYYFLLDEKHVLFGEND